MLQEDTAARYLSARAASETTAVRLVLERSAEAAAAHLAAARAHLEALADTLVGGPEQLSPHSANRSRRA